MIYAYAIHRGSIRVTYIILYIYVYIHAHIHTYIHTYIRNTYIHKYIRTYIHTYIHTYICVCVSNRRVWTSYAQGNCDHDHRGRQAAVHQVCYAHRSCPRSLTLTLNLMPHTHKEHVMPLITIVEGKLLSTRYVTHTDHVHAHSHFHGAYAQRAWYAHSHSHAQAQRDATCSRIHTRSFSRPTLYDTMIVLASKTNSESRHKRTVTVTVTHTRYPSADLNPPGTIVWKGFNANMEAQYQFGRAEGGMQLSPEIHTVTLNNPLPIIKACSQFAGGALVLQFNGDGMTGSLIDFFVSTNPQEVQPNNGMCPGRREVTMPRFPLRLT
jgi:hypothetical protein